MEYNPYIQKYDRLRSDISRINNEKSRLFNELKWFDTTDVSNLLSTLVHSETTKNNYISLMDKIEIEIKILNDNIQAARKKVKTLFNPLNWFDDQQIKFREILTDLGKDLNAKQIYKAKTLQSLANTNSTINKINADIDRYKKFDRMTVSYELTKLDRELSLLVEEFEKTGILKNNVDAALQPVIQQISKYESDISVAKSKLSSAQSFDEDLTLAKNSYERAKIHEKCEISLGESSPIKIINYQERNIRQLERDLVKSKKRANEIGIKASREIKSIIIDGNNMCYEGSKFVGLNPLLQTTNELQRQYKVTVIFDSAIRSLIHPNDDMIRSQFNSNVTIHVVASEKLADETILDIASNDKASYVISNDRFGEYNDKEVVMNNRLIRHEIVSGRVIIHDLGINIEHNPNELRQSGTT